MAAEIYYTRAKGIRISMPPGMEVMAIIKRNPGNENEGGPFVFGVVIEDKGEKVQLRVTRSEWLWCSVGSCLTITKMDVYYHPLPEHKQLSLFWE